VLQTSDSKALIGFNPLYNLTIFAKMKTKFQVPFISILLLVSCSAEIDFSNLNGSWIPEEAVNNGLNISEEIMFNDYGQYRAVSIFGDTLTYEVEGEFILDHKNNSIEMEFVRITKNDMVEESLSDSSSEIRIIELTETKLTLETKNGRLAYTKKLKGVGR